MTKNYGAQSKEDLLEENAFLKDQIAFYESGEDNSRIRLSALGFAAGLGGGMAFTSVDELVTAAITLEKYINGEAPDPDPNPDVPVPSPS